MILFLKENLATIIVLLIVMFLVVLAVFKLVRDRKKGKSSCGCGCSGCPMKDSCHSKKK